ncbi:flagellar hook-length control protein FliK [Silvimonas iriomotensis]|uniref:Flagellar hook-length control protein-like C-terminal domain-containing protein n=1 Tax=Silvimonas iriomotensis TaxID=449662 RepID=A0ABQ2P565_9NEIS|nr:flagellar hook-length control protein FliK [Silvimonas iriomotensis]GGP18613.1 hypothetical protein GCM10010970_05930 [Silvimonas iriomotensis]
MLPGNAIVTLQALLLNNSTQTPEARPDLGALFTQGEQVSATVMGALGNGRFAVQINNQLLDLNLPAGATAGEKLDLTVLANRPTLTFALSSATSPDYHPGVSTEFSNGARYLSDLLNAGNNKAGTTAQTAQTSAAAPLFEGAPNAADLAGKLAQTLDQSGLFYESHQAQWVDGQRSLQTLQQEPQARLAQQASTQTAAATDSKTASTLIKDLTSQDVASMKAASTAAGNRPDLSGANMNHLTGTPDQQAALAGLVQRQLDAIDRQAILWQGQAWPGQQMQWSVQADDQGRNAAYADPADRQWRTTLNLDMPHLGHVAISAVLYQGQFNLQFKASPEAIKELQSAQSALDNQFEGAGLELASVAFASVKEPADGQ